METGKQKLPPRGGSEKSNGMERKLLRCLKANDLPFEYTGDGKFWIEKTCPDFVGTGKKKVLLELNGCYWHNCPICYPKGDAFKGNGEKDKAKLKLYKRYGFKVIEIWGHEMEDDWWDIVVAKIKK